MPRKVRELKSELRKLGFVENTRGGKGSHTKWTHPLLPGVTLIISGRDRDDAERYQEHHIRRAIETLRELS